jgi:phosphoadenosine phosphosulfate reductase
MSLNAADDDGSEPSVADAPASRRLGRVEQLVERYRGVEGAALLQPLLEREFPGRLAVVSSFGAESAVIPGADRRDRPGYPCAVSRYGQIVQ